MKAIKRKGEGYVSFAHSFSHDGLAARGPIYVRCVLNAAIFPQN
jgi:hypothetical protein